jgi:hypothetical protein
MCSWERILNAVNLCFDLQIFISYADKLYMMCVCVCVCVYSWEMVMVNFLRKIY